MDWLLVGLGGAGGALLRYVVSGWIMKKWQKIFPLGTWFVNVSGSFLIGLLTPLAITIVNRDWFLFLGTGVLGAYTTFSTFSTEIVKLWREVSWRAAFFYVAITVIPGLAATALGLWIGLVMASS